MVPWWLSIPPRDDFLHVHAPRQHLEPGLSRRAPPRVTDQGQAVSGAGTWSHIQAIAARQQSAAEVSPKSTDTASRAARRGPFFEPHLVADFRKYRDQAVYFKGSEFRMQRKAHQCPILGGSGRTEHRAEDAAPLQGVAQLLPALLAARADADAVEAVSKAQAAGSDNAPTASSATRTSSAEALESVSTTAPISSRPPRRQDCWSMSAMTSGSAVRSGSGRTARWPACARWRRVGRCCAPPIRA